MNKTLLSICIPTYNRANCLKVCLDSIVPQFKNKEVLEQVEVVISDNASSDNTTEVIKEFQNKFKNIKYFRNKINIGFDQNLLNAVEKSSGEYCLTFGDDDGFFPNSFSLILQKIKTLQVPYFILNCWGYDHELIHPVLSHSNGQITEDRVYGSLAEFVRSIKKYIDLVGSFGSMSTQLFRRKVWMDFDKKEEYIGTQTIHLFVLLSIFKDSRFALLAEPVVKTRNDNMRWNTYPGLETNKKRGLATVKTILWISDLYGLSISPFKAKIYFLNRVYWVSLKELVKKILFMVGLRK